MAQSTKPARRIAPATIVLILAALIALVVIVISATRAGEADTSAANATAPVPTQPQGPSLEDDITALQRQLQTDPDNARAWFELGARYRALGVAGDAERAFRRASELEPRNAEYVTYLGEAVLVRSPQGPTPADLNEAETLFNRALGLDPRLPMARFYAATMKDQRGRHQEAIDDLLALLREAPPGAEWQVNVRRSVENIARAQNIDISGRLPPPSPGTMAADAIPGPTREEMDAARSKTPSEQNEMVSGMVSRLAARLQQNPRDERGWMMLMRSRKVLNQEAEARQALQSGLQAFADDPAAQQRLRKAAQQLGIPAS